MRVSHFSGIFRFGFMARQRGVTLIEVLVALVVVAVGLLGAANLQVRALQSQQNSYNATVANLIAKDVKERMWLLMVSADESGVYRSCSDLSASNPVESIESLAHSEWQEALPELSVNIDSEAFSGSPCAFVVSIKWRDDRFGWIGVDLGEPDGEGGESQYGSFDYYVRLPGIENGGS